MARRHRVESVVTRPAPPEDSERNIYLVLTLVLQMVVAAGFVVFTLRGEWEQAFFSAVTLVLTLLPAFVSRRYRVHIPPEFQLITVLFVFLAEYLGTVRGLFDRFWWWDMVLHASSGFLLGIVGFIVLFLLNRTDRLPRGMRPVFLCFFGFTFSVTIGVLWEIYEFTVDQLIPGMNAQSTETGVKDTMHDLIVNMVGALTVSLMGWVYLRAGRNSFIVDAIRKFTDRNPHLFGKGRKAT